MVRWLKKTFQAMMLSSAVLLGACESVMPLTGNYAPLTEKRKELLEDKIIEIISSEAVITGEHEETIVHDETGNLKSVSFKGIPQEFLTHYLDFTIDEFKKKGLEIKGYEYAVMSIQKENAIKDICHGKLGCYNPDSVIYLTSREFKKFLPNAMHEYGHYLYFGNGEYCAIANEKYSILKLFQFSEKVGSFILDELWTIKDKTPISEQAANYGMYSKSQIFAALNLLNHKGNIEQSLDYVLHEYTQIIDSQLDGYLKDSETDDMQKVYFTTWEKILTSDWIIEELTRTSGHLDHDTARELVSFLRIDLYKKHSEHILNKWFDKSMLPVLVKEFLEDPDFDNPLFRFEITNMANNDIYRDILYLHGNHRIIKAFDNARKFLELNQRYPCTKDDLFECPKSARYSNLKHVDVYNMMNMIAVDYGSYLMKKEALEHSLDFVRKFYPGVDILEQDFEAWKENKFFLYRTRSPQILLNAGKIALSIDEPTLAESFLKFAVYHDCLEEGTLQKKNAACTFHKEKAQEIIDDIDAGDQ